MPRHTQENFSFDVPSDWRDGSVVAFHSPAGATLVVTRDPIRPGQTLRQYADQELLKLGKNLTDFDLFESGETEVGGRPAIHMRWAWLSPEGEVEQSITMVEQEKDGKRVAMTFTTGVPRDDAEAARPFFQGILDSVTFDNPVPAAPRSAPASAPSPVDPSEPLHIPMPGAPHHRP
jgi:hypothetical protein